jgi:hypothetical protein
LTARLILSSQDPASDKSKQHTGYIQVTMNFDFHIGSLELRDREDPSVLDPEVLSVSDSSIVVGRLSTTSGMYTALFSSPRSSASLGTGGVKSTAEVGLFYSESVEDFCFGLMIASAAKHLINVRQIRINEIRQKFEMDFSIFKE